MVRRGQAVPKSPMVFCAFLGNAVHASHGGDNLSHVDSQPNSGTERELQERLESAYDENGVDRSLIRWSLSLSPTERVRGVEETLNALETLKRVSK